MDFEETLQTVDYACANVFGMNRIDQSEIFRAATQIYLANLPKKNLLKRLQEAKEDIDDLSYYTCDGQSVDEKDILKILDELIESVKV